MTTTNIRNLNKNLGITSTYQKPNTLTTSTSDMNIYNVQQNQLDITGYMYDGLTVMHINSTSNSNTNYTTGKYFDPSQSASNQNFRFNGNQNIANSNVAYTSLLSNTYAQNLNNTGSLYSLDITNGTQATPASNPLFFSLTADPYTNSSNTNYNTVPGYSTTSASSSFTFQSQYSFTTTEQVLVVKLLFVINATQSLNVQNTTTAFPTINVTVINQVYTKDNIAKNEPGKIYQNSAILRYTDSVSSFDPKKTTQFLFNNIPLVFAPGFEKEFVTCSVLYIPPVLDSGIYYGQYLPSTGDYFENGMMNFDTDSFVQTTQPTNFGYFVVGVAYQNESAYTSYLIGGINAEVTIKNFWNSPLSIYNNYNTYSVLDMELINVILLSGNNVNGGQFLVVNSGTPISCVNKFALTNLQNFMTIMNAFLEVDNGTVPLLDYFTSAYQIKRLNEKGYPANLVVFESLYDTNVIYNPTNYTLDTSTYVLLHAANTGNVLFNSNDQKIINKNIKKSYYGFDNSVLSSFGNVNYANIELKNITTVNNTTFGNCLYLGQINVSGKLYYSLLMLPESGFIPDYTVSPCCLTIYATNNTNSYVANSTNTSTQFVPGAITVSSGTNSYSLSNIQLTVSNDRVI